MFILFKEKEEKKIYDFLHIYILGQLIIIKQK